MVASVFLLELLPDHQDVADTKFATNLELEGRQLEDVFLLVDVGKWP